MVDVLLERLGLGRPHHPLDRPHGQRRVGGDLAGQLGREGLRTRSSGTAWLTMPSSRRLGRGQRAPAERQLGRLGVADHPRQQPRAAALGEDPALGEAGVQLGRGRGDADVAAEREVEPVAGGATVERAHRRRVELVEDDRRRAAQVELAGPRPPATRGCRGSRRPLDDWAARSRPAQNARPAPVSTMQRTSRSASASSSRADRSPQHRPGDRVHPLRRVERDRGDVIGRPSYRTSAHRASTVATAPAAGSRVPERLAPANAPAGE